MVAASTNQVATPYDALAPRPLLLIAFRTTPKIAKSSTRQTRETKNASRTIKEANKKPNCLDPRAMIWAIKAIPHAMGWRINARDARSAEELS
jgi:hypothetical protein